jgi:deoxyribonuclease V
MTNAKGRRIGRRPRVRWRRGEPRVPVADMDIPELHRWDVTPAEAVALQRELAGRTDLSRAPAHFDLLAGADISYNLRSPRLYATVIVWRVSDGQIVETCDAVRDVPFPYVPGLLSFREAPALLDAFRQLRSVPDAVVFDGQGVAHPRRLGIAAHMGLWLGLPCLGCAKSRLTGAFAEPAPEAGSTSPLSDRGEVIGTVLRTRDRVKPVFVSPGHRIDHAGAVRVVLAACRGYRLPEPTRLADRRVGELRRAAGGGREVTS